MERLAGSKECRVVDMVGGHGLKRHGERAIDALACRGDTFMLDAQVFDLGQGQAGYAAIIGDKPFVRV